MKVLLLSAYAAQSHVHWQSSLQAMFPHWSWQVLTLPPRHFSWRVRGNPLVWALQERAVLEAEYDFLLVTSMVDLATLRGLVPALSRLPCAVYFHENQFAYPQTGVRHSLLEAQMVSLYAALAADKVVFNSSYNRKTFLAGCAQLLRRLPDYIPDGVVDLLAEKASVIPVPYGNDADADAAATDGWPGGTRKSPGVPPRIVWVGRFEHDKNPAGLLRILTELESLELNYELAVVGQQFRASPAEFAQIEETFGHRLVRFGYVESTADYIALLQGSDVVLSTALHEFQGVAVLQAVAAGAVPVVPARLVYPELFGARYCYDSHADNLQLEAISAASLIQEVVQALQTGHIITPDISRFSQDHLASAYRSLLCSNTRAHDGG